MKRSRGWIHLRWATYVCSAAFVFLSIASASFSQAAPMTHNLPDDAFKTLSSTKQVPASVKREFEKAIGGRFEMADPGGDFAAGCVRMEGVPSMRMRLAGLSQDHCVLFYESGGFAHSFNVALFSLTPDKATLTWKTYLSPKKGLSVKGLEDLKKALQAE